MVSCQIGKAIYDDIAFTIPARIDASGAYYVIEEIKMDMNEENKIIEREVLGWTRDANGNVIDCHPVEVANCVIAGKRENTQNYVLEVGVSVNPFSHKLEYKGEASISEDVSPCLRATDYKCPHVVHERIMFKGREIKEGDGLYTETTADFFHGGLDGVSRALKAEMHDAGVCVKNGSRYRIRKLTERECFRLMGVDDNDIDTIQATGISRTQQYKMAGNSIVVDVLYHIFRKMFVETKADAGTQLELF